MAIWKDKGHNTSKTKAQSTWRESACTHHGQASTHEPRTGAEAGNVRQGLVREGFVKAENFKADSEGGEEMRYTAGMD